MSQPMMQMAERIVQDLFTTPRKVTKNENSVSFGAYILGEGEDSEKRCWITVACDPGNSSFFLVGALVAFSFKFNPEVVEFVYELDNNVTPFVEYHYQTIGELVLEVHEDEYLVPTYQGVIQYENLDDQELQYELKLNIARCLKTLSLIYPIIVQTFNEQRAPSTAEQIRMLYKAYGLWEVYGVSHEVPDGQARLPPGLFGGIQYLGCQ